MFHVLTDMIKKHFHFQRQQENTEKHSKNHEKSDETNLKTECHILTRFSIEDILIQNWSLHCDLTSSMSLSKFYLPPSQV